MAQTPVAKTSSADADDVSILYGRGRTSSPGHPRSPSTPTAAAASGKNSDGSLGTATSMLTESPAKATPRPSSPTLPHRSASIVTHTSPAPASHPSPPAAPTTTASGFQRPCATQPFGEYVVASMFLGDRSSIAQVAACCATLYLTRSDPDRLKQLVAMFAELFPKHRRAILERITGRLERRRQRTSSASVEVFGSSQPMPSLHHRQEQHQQQHKVNMAPAAADGEPSLEERDLSSQGPVSVERTASYRPDAAVVEELPIGGGGDGGGSRGPPAGSYAAAHVGSGHGASSERTNNNDGDHPNQPGNHRVDGGQSSEGSSGGSSRCTSPGASSLSSIDPLFRQPTISLHREDVVEYFLAIVHRLVIQYFSYNWDQAPRVISINQDYKAFVDKELIPAVLQRQTSAVFVAGQHSASSGTFVDGDGEYPTRGEDGTAQPIGASADAGTTASLQPEPPSLLRTAHSNSSSNMLGVDYNSNGGGDVGGVFASVTEETIVDWCREHGGGGSGTSSSEALDGSGDGIALRPLPTSPTAKGGRTLLLFFHAPFSQPSCTMWAVLEALQRRWRGADGDGADATTPAIGVVHGVAELELVRIFGVTWFPTLLLIPAGQGSAVADMVVKQSVLWEQELEASAAAAECGGEEDDAAAALHRQDQTHPDQPPHHDSCREQGEAAQPPPCAPCGTIAQLPQQQPQSLPRSYSTGLPYVSDTAPPLYDGQLYFRFPEKGVVLEDAVNEWVQGQGKVEAKQRKFKTWITRLASLSAQMKYKPFRELQSAVIMLKRLQLGGGGHHDAMSSTAGSPTTALTEHLVAQQRHVSVEDPPLFVFLGGGMAAGKTTAATVLTRSEWWQTHKDDVVVVDADTFKAADPMRNSASSDIHAQSTKFAEQLLVTALNQGRSVIFDGTMMWQPFVEQTVDMVRSAHTHRYAMGRGFDPDNGIEEYWVQTGPRESPLEAPYRIVLLAITVEPQEAVPRGILRGISTGRSVPIKGQLRSFRLFSVGFRRYLNLCDEVTLYNNNVRVDLDKGELPPAILHRESLAHDVVIDDPHAYELFLKHEHINDSARNHEEIYLSAEHCMPTSPSASYSFPLPKGG